MARDAAGRFLSGSSGNPSGRPKLPEGLRSGLTLAAEGALGFLAAVQADETAPLAARVVAARALLAAAVGRQGVALEDVPAGPPVVDMTLAGMRSPELVEAVGKLVLRREGETAEMLLRRCCDLEELLDWVEAGYLTTPAAVAAVPLDERGLIVWGWRPPEAVGAGPAPEEDGERRPLFLPSGENQADGDAG